MAVDDGTLSETRYASYLKLKKETDYHDLSYLEKKKKGKDLARLVKNMKKIKGR